MHGAAVPQRHPCRICKHAQRAAIDEAAAAAPRTLEGRVEVAQAFSITESALERHLAKCAAKATKPTRRRRAAKAGPEDAPPDSGPREAPEAHLEAPGGEEPEVAPLPPPRELAAPDAELRRRAQLLTRQLEHMIEQRAEARHIANVANALAGVDKLMLAREKGQRPIDEHPAFEGLVMDLVAAVVDELGPRAPSGIEARIAERLEGLQAARAAAAAVERRAA